MSSYEGTSITPSLDRAIGSVLGAVAAPGRYPSGTSFIAADLPSFYSHFHRAIGEDRPVVVVLPDGNELFVEPRRDVLSCLLRRARRVLASRSLTRLRSALRPSQSGPLVHGGALDGPFDVPLVRLLVPGYETHLHGLRRHT